MHRKVAVALVALLALGLASCGGTKKLSATDFRSQVNAVCQHVSAQITVLQRKATEASKVSSLQQAAADMTAGLKRMDAIEAPASMAQRYAALKSGWSLRRDGALELAKPHPHLSAAVARALDAHHNPITRTAQSLGVRSCT